MLFWASLVLRAWGALLLVKINKTVVTSLPVRWSSKMKNLCHMVKWQMFPLPSHTVPFILLFLFSSYLTITGKILPVRSRGSDTATLILQVPSSLSLCAEVIGKYVFGFCSLTFISDFCCSQNKFLLETGTRDEVGSFDQVLLDPLYKTDLVFVNYAPL